MNHPACARLTLVPLAVLILSAGSRTGVSISTRDSLSVQQGVYTSLYFLAEPVRTTDTNLPVQYRFTESGTPPPGMRFEVYPCNKPSIAVCPQLATANGIYLDGTPTDGGSYPVVITATDTDGRKASQRFTIVVRPSTAGSK